MCTFPKHQVSQFHKFVLITGNGNEICIDAPAGSYALKGGRGVAQCPMGTFSAVVGTEQCQRCPAGRITPGIGAAAELDCVSPKWNFYQAFVVLLIMTPFCFEYFLMSRFPRLAFLRRKRVYAALTEETRGISAWLLRYTVKFQAQRVIQWGWHPVRNLFVIWGAILLVISGAFF